MAKPISFLVKLQYFNKTFFTFWLNHLFFGIDHTQENLKGIIESDDYIIENIAKINAFWVEWNFNTHFKKNYNIFLMDKFHYPP